MTTSRTYKLPTPVCTCGTEFSSWHTGHLTATDNNPNLNLYGASNYGVVALFATREEITIDEHDGETLTLNYDAARRVGLALLAAVEEANTLQENQ